MIGKTLAHYEITALLGKGGMGEVFRARDTKLDRDVALKILPREMSGDRERSARFEREARTLASLQHANIASIYGYEDVDGVRFLAMELVEGEDLATRLQRGAVSIDEAMSIAREIATGLEAAHERNIVHRDLKPANVMLGPDGSVKILDFGLARAYTGDSDEGDPSLSPTITAAMTMAGTILGTAAYMSPEQARGKRVDKRTDIWAFGVMLYEMLTGTRLYEGETITDILGAIVHRSPDLEILPAKVPGSIKTMLARCLTSDAQERLRDIGEARIALTHPRDQVESAPRPASGSALRVLLAAVLPVAIVLVAGWWLWPRDQADPRVVRSSIQIPEGQTVAALGLRGGSIRLSPDGRAIAYVGQDEVGRRIWVRNLEESESRPIPGTDGAHRPFWSPDGRSIGYFVDGALRRISVAGGAPLTVANTPNGRGATWLENGLIVYAPTPDSPLFAVPASGGTARQITDPGTRSHREPRRLPGSNRFLYLEQIGGGGWGVFAGTTDDSSHVQITSTGGGAEYADGRLLFLKGRTLVAQPLDAATLELTGEPTPLAENIIRDSNFGIGVFSSADGGMLCYQAGALSGRSIMWMDRSGQLLRTQRDRSEYGEIELSVDGTMIAAVVENTNGGSDIWLIDVEKDTRRRLTFSPDREITRRIEVNWSHDGSFLVYAIEYDGGSALFRKSSDGTGEEEELLSIPDVSLWPYDVTPDSRWVLFGRQAPGGGEDLWILPLDGSEEPHALMDTPYDEWPGAISPDSRWLAYDSDETGRREIFVVPFPEGRGRWQVSDNGGRYPQWSADGEELYYASPNGDLMSVALRATDGVLESEEPVRLFKAATNTGSFGFFSAHPSGQRFAILDQANEDVPISLFVNWPQAVDQR